MGQIPVFGGSQRIEVGSPVAIGGGEKARMQGEAIAGFGDAMFKVGNLLDTVGARAKEAHDKLSVITAVNMGRMALLEKKAEQDALGLQKDDRADGYSGVVRFTDAVDPVLLKIREEHLPKELWTQFDATISDDIVTESTKVLGGEVKKREETVQLMRQDNVMGKAAFLRADPSQVELMMGEMELNVLNDPMISDKDKPPTILKNKQQLAQGVLGGHIDRGNAGDSSSWDKARKDLSEKFGQLFSAEQLEKERSQIDASQYGFENRWNAAEARRISAAKRAADAAMQGASNQYLQSLSGAGNNETKRAPVMRAIELDPRFDAYPDRKKALLENRTFMELADDRYEVTVISEALGAGKTKKSFDRLRLQVGADNNIKVSPDRATRLLKYLDGMQDAVRKDPGLMEHYRTKMAQLDDLQKSSPIDPISGLFSSERVNQINQARASFSMSAMSKLSAGTLTMDGINAAYNNAIGSVGMGAQKAPYVPGMAPERQYSMQGLIKEKEDINRRFRAGEFKTEAQKKAAADRLRKINAQTVEVGKQNTTNLAPTTAPTKKVNKAFDE